MTRTARLPLLTLLLLAFNGALGGCQALAGIEDRSYAPGASAECQTYCALAQEVCTGNSALYASDATCHGICQLLDPGNPNEPTGDNIACRINQLKLAKTTTEVALYCAQAGPATNGACASNCESYCALFTAACPMGFEPGDCVARCAGLTDTGGFDVNTNYYGDTLQCRFVHISAATLDQVDHCPHAGLPANGPCLGKDPTTTVPDCDSFCHLEMTECSGDLQQYETPEQCSDVCNALVRGTVANSSGSTDSTGNTVACRKYHSYNALIDPMTHCAHTGPGGEGHCGSNAAPDTGSTGNCESYCTLLSKACAANFGSFGDQTACEADCVKLDGAAPNSPYSTAASGNNLQCRLLHVSRALSPTLASADRATECAAATGSAPCK